MSIAFAPWSSFSTMLCWDRCLAQDMPLLAISDLMGRTHAFPPHTQGVCRVNFQVSRWHRETCTHQAGDCQMTKHCTACRGPRVHTDTCVTYWAVYLPRVPPVEYSTHRGKKTFPHTVHTRGLPCRPILHQETFPHPLKITLGGPPNITQYIYTIMHIMYCTLYCTLQTGQNFKTAKTK